MLKVKYLKKKFQYPMLKWAKDLFPICRSITGQGVRDTINYFKKINPELSMKSIKTGTKVFDWIIPNEWNIYDAYIQHNSGKKYAEFKKNNLHVIGYSSPVNKVLSKKDLFKNIYTLNNQKNLIPYVTSYYKKKWGFCMSEKKKRKLPSGKYRVYINSTLKSGNLNYAEALIKGRSKKEVLFSSYICHPSLATELLGSVLCNAIQRYVKANYKKLYYSYRFVYVPETIGSIAYISKNLKTLKKNVFLGYIITCIGNNREYSHIKTRNGSTIADSALESALLNKKNVKQYSFLHRGSDERQYCAPGIDLPVAGFCNTKYGEYPEYHTHADNLKIINSNSLNDSFNLFKLIIDSLEMGIYPKVNVLCEPHLNKRNLYPDLSIKDSTKNIFNRMNIIAYSDGKINIFDLAKLIQVPLEDLIEEIRLLVRKKILTTKYF